MCKAFLCCAFSINECILIHTVSVRACTSTWLVVWSLHKQHVAVWVFYILDWPAGYSHLGKSKELEQAVFGKP